MTSQQNKSHSTTDNKDIDMQVVLKDQILNERYMVFNQIGSGCYGSIFRCGDLNKPKHHLVIKISENIEVLGNEIEAVIQLRAHHKENESAYPYDYFPRCISKGLFVFDAQNPKKEIQCLQTSKQFDAMYQSNMKAMSFYVMNEFGQNLDKFFESVEGCFSKKTVFQIGIRLIDIF